MSEEKQLYESAQVWNQELQLGQKNTIRAIKDFFPPGVSTCLDVGCGDGKVTSAIIDATGVPIVGLDFSEEALSRCNFQTVQGDATALPFDDRQFDLVMTTDMLEHLADDIENDAWQQLFRVAAKWVMVSVPFREELLDATSKCQSCGTEYHVNWHVRAYDLAALLQRAPIEWEPEVVTLTGEPWPPYHPAETYYRRKLIGEWSGWTEAVCPHCGKNGAAPDPVTAVPPLTARTLADVIYSDLAKRWVARSHSEILILYRRAASVDKPEYTPPPAGSISCSAVEWHASEIKLESNLPPFPQSAHAVCGLDDTMVLQLPAYGLAQTLEMRLSREHSIPLSFSVEDGVGLVFSGEIFAEHDGTFSIDLPRPVSPGYYGVLVRLPVAAPLLSIRLGVGPVGEQIFLDKNTTVGYRRFDAGRCPAYIQVTDPIWLDARYKSVELISDHDTRRKQLFEDVRNAFGLEGDVVELEIEGLVGSEPDGELTVQENRVRVLEQRLSQKAQQEVGELSELDAEHERVTETKHILMLCHDQHLDRRVIAQAESLVQAKHKVTLVALSYDAGGTQEITPEGIHLVRIGLSEIVPENPTYKAYCTRQGNLNGLLNSICNRLPFGHRFLHIGFGLASKANWNFYRAALLARYRNRSLSDPLPFRTAFIKAGKERIADVVQVHDLPALEAGVELAALWNVPLVYDAHELYPEQRSFSVVQKRICSEAEAKAIKHAQLIFAVNQSIAEEMAKRYDIEQPIVLLNAIDPLPAFDPHASYNLLREKLGLGPERRILLFQGGFSPHRNLEQLIEAMALVKAPDVDLVMMGFGPFGDVLKNKAQRLKLMGKRVYFLPAVPQSELLQHSASADMGIIPYPHVDLNSYYCTPNKLFEFIQAGLPILANDSPELRRFVSEGWFGLVKPMHSQKQIASAIDEAFASIEETAACRERLIEHRHKFSWKAQHQTYLQAMLMLMKIDVPNEAAAEV